MNLLNTLFFRIGFGVFLCASGVGRALAAAAGTGSSMPWDDGLSKLVTNLTGKTALAVGVLAMFAAAAALVFGGQMSDFTRRIILMILSIAVLVSGSSLLTTFFPGLAGAMVL